MKLFSLLFLFLVFISAGRTFASDTQYVLFSPLLNEGKVGATGAWEITDPCAASMSQQ